MAMPLSALPKALGLSTDLVAKGEFPHRANKPCNWDKKIPFPAIDQYMIEKRSKKDRASFSEWWAEESARCGGVMDFRKVLMDYCSSDVTVLRLVVIQLRKLFRQLTRIDILDHVTIASACRFFFASDLMVPNEIALISAHGYQPNRKTSIEATEYLEYQNACVVGNDIEHGRNGKEQAIGKYFVDGIDRHRDEVYEYNGCQFHGHPDCTDPEAKTPFGNKTMAQAFEETERKREFLERQGLTVITMWSCEWHRERKEPEVAEFLSGLNLRKPVCPADFFFGGRVDSEVGHKEADPALGNFIRFFLLLPY
jgi:hypothetical protein